jgi:hypothetical protein
MSAESQKLTLPQSFAATDAKIEISGLPEPSESGRWVASLKAQVVGRLLEFREGPMRDFAIYLAAQKYATSGTSEQEIRGWVRRSLKHGNRGLRTTRVQMYGKLDHDQ